MMRLISAGQVHSQGKSIHNLKSILYTFYLHDKTNEDSDQPRNQFSLISLGFELKG